MKFTVFDREKKGLSGIALLFIAVVVPLALLGHIADEVHEGDTLAFDQSILNGLHGHLSSAPLDYFFIQVAHWGGFYGLLPLTLGLSFLLWARKRGHDAIFILSSVGGACLLNVVCKHLFGRARPALWLSPAPQTDFGFPSGHAMLSTAFFGAVITLVWTTRWRWPAVLMGVFLVGLICFSRLYLGVHYPTDIIAGILASLVWINGLHRLRRALRF